MNDKKCTWLKEEPFCDQPVVIRMELLPHKHDDGTVDNTSTEHFLCHPHLFEFCQALTLSVIDGMATEIKEELELLTNDKKAVA